MIGDEIRCDSDDSLLPQTKLLELNNAVLLFFLKKMLSAACHLAPSYGVIIVRIKYLFEDFGLIVHFHLPLLQNDIVSSSSLHIQVSQCIVS